MEQGTFDFQVLDAENMVSIAVSYFFENAYNSEKVFQKVFSQKFFTEMYSYLENSKKSAVTKFHTLFVLKELICQNDKKVLALLSASVQFFELLEKIAVTTDPKKPLSEKGKNLFSGDRDGKYGNNFIRLLLQILIYLGTKFPNASKGGPTRFKKILMNLQEQNVTLPKEYIYMPSKKTKESDKEVGEKDPEPKLKKEKKVSDSDQDKKINSTSIPSLIRFVTFKIQEYMETLEEIQETNELEQYINKSHQIFQTETIKFNELGDKAMQEDQNTIMDLLKVRRFLDEEDELYKRYIPKGQYDGFYNQIKIIYPQIFQGVEAATPTPQPPPPAVKGTGSSMREEPKRQSSKRRQPEYQKEAQSPQVRPRNEASGVQRNSQGHASQMVGDLFRKMQSRSKSPANGFRLIKESLQKQKKNIHANPPRQKQHRAISASRLAASTLTRTGMKTPSIFNNVPNPNPSYKSYDGDLVLVSKELEQILYDIKKEQGSKRFKVSNLRDKYILYENESIQIGYKSQAIFQEYDGFNTFLSLELFLGNKTSRQIKELQITFQSDQNTLIYTSPRQIRSVIDPETQIKHELMLVPIKVPYTFINMKFYYINGSVPVHATVALPNSILKMTTHIELSRTQFHNYLSNTNKTYKTEIFKLSHHFPPNALRKYIPVLQELGIDFTQFSTTGNNEDYELYCITEIWQNYEGVLKISIRPDLTVILQLSAIDPSEDASKHLKVYLQTLQMVLQGS